MKTLNSFSVLIENTGASQIAFFVIGAINNLTNSRPNIDVILFYENKHKDCISTNFSTMQISECWGYNGPVIATSFSTAKKLINLPSTSKKIFYVWNLEWMGVNKYEDYEGVYTNKNIELVARSDDHKKIIENTFNRKVSRVISDFNIQDILEVLE